MLVTSGGQVGIGTTTPVETLDVAGRIRSQNLATSATAASQVDASSSDCLGALTSAKSACDMPNMIVTATTGNVPVIIMANINGVLLDGSGCVMANFALVMDGQIIAASNIDDANQDTLVQVTSVTMMSLQSPAPGRHTFEVQESDDTGFCNSSTIRTLVGIPSGTSSNFSTRTLIVHEL